MKNLLLFKCIFSVHVFVFEMCQAQTLQDNKSNISQVKWAPNCDFPGNDIASMAVSSEQCGGQCLSNSKCTHFTWYYNVCLLKKALNPRVTGLNGAVCGFVANRDIGGVGSGGMNRNSYDYQTLLKTIYSEARGESELGQRAVAWVIYNRAKLNREYWGGSTLAGVCKRPSQFECWNGKSDIIMSEIGARDAIDRWLPSVFQGSDPTFGSQYFNNPDNDGYPDWTTRVIRTIKIGGHQFYKE